ncbi:MAG: CPBP family intramembrane metalloprotease [Gemmatimonadetes bacterium]|nr:CPBP family intramembrane metalloprotease [Gemmatimonadota bacterium]NIR80834.1 CPBP family intramembrane metalloprotease [Gemmatimonadota bacterium]NIT85468.1 CPBP family intramembrane metalloprotease [Gemmatimonadota bacterium]NIU29292.1 CPBP family intramembrane metalloprotease [Gemmatimonadota bacterium]NIU34369.1 CPBP family intramembrane metalloprotease [Gemmatimonadota bacterium]
MILRFVAVAFGATWVGVAPLALQGLGVLSGVPEWLHGAGALGPLLAALSAVRATDWSAGLPALYGRWGEPGMTRAWTAACLSTPVIFGAVAAVVAVVGGAELVGSPGPALRDGEWLLGLAVAAVLYGLGEEPGWRGWLLPRLQATRSPVRATLILAPIWAAWHAPFFLYRYDFGGVGTLVGFFVGLLAGAFWLTFVFNSTGGSVRVVASWHVLWNVANLVLAEVSSLAVAVLNVLMMALGFGVAAWYGPRGLRVGDAPIPTKEG